MKLVVEHDPDLNLKPTMKITLSISARAGVSGSSALCQLIVISALRESFRRSLGTVMTFFLERTTKE
jgi:hypothetical protein